MQAGAIVSLKTTNPNEIGGSVRNELAGSSFGFKSGSSVLPTSSNVTPFNWTDVLVRFPKGGVSQYMSRLLEASSEFWRFAVTVVKFRLSISSTTLPSE